MLSCRINCAAKNGILARLSRDARGTANCKFEMLNTVFWQNRRENKRKNVPFEPKIAVFVTFLEKTGVRLYLVKLHKIGQIAQVTFAQMMANG